VETLENQTYSKSDLLNQPYLFQVASDLLTQDDTVSYSGRNSQTYLFQVDAKTGCKKAILGFDIRDSYKGIGVQHRIHE
jgi:hypothetical protein